MADFSKAVEIDPDNSDIYHHRGQVHLLTEQIDNAADDFKKAVDLNPEFPVAYVQKLYTDYRRAVQKNDQVSQLPFRLLWYHILKDLILIFNLQWTKKFETIS